MCRGIKDYHTGVNVEKVIIQPRCYFMYRDVIGGLLFRKRVSQSRAAASTTSLCVLSQAVF